MKYTVIYQTLEDRCNDDEVEAHGPYRCTLYENGFRKSGARVPWLGEGYYFWDSRIEDAKWWGKTVYVGGGFIICKTQYDSHSPCLLDLVGDLDAIDDFRKCVTLLKQERGLKNVRFSAVLNYLKGMSEFQYKAVRVWPTQYVTRMSSEVEFPGGRFLLGNVERVQICFFDKTLLQYPFRVVYREEN